MPAWTQAIRSFNRLSGLAGVEGGAAVVEVAGGGPGAGCGWPEVDWEQALSAKIKAASAAIRMAPRLAIVAQHVPATVGRGGDSMTSEVIAERRSGPLASKCEQHRIIGGT
ncbi:hypothetical protein GCM10009764_00440 [Nocardia ninae]|uniref:Uncharacterized protein n=1 Tax=Nocardia ninae NBRC 108245 TaxID=1210091 RepID=A0A511MQM5_9NOCA|nr:hypothetical protein NN4_72900 [Nocardia ninae NBRC 108245]